MHTDADVWVTVLVAVGECTHSGGFAHATTGAVHAMRRDPTSYIQDSDILTYVALHLHLYSYFLPLAHA